jgi:drug/metabolite transporter (DMT)-like permease
LPSPLRVHLALLTVSLVFGANYVFTKRILATVPPEAWVWFRIVAATVVMVPLAFALRRSAGGWPRPALLLGLGLASFFGVVLNQVLFTEGLHLTTAEHSAVINAGIPTWTLIVAVCVGQERLGWQRVLAIVLALAGVLYLLGFDQLVLAAPADPAADDGRRLLGDLLTMANGIAFAVHLVLMRRIGAGTDPWTATAVMFVTASFMVSLWSAPALTEQQFRAVLAPPTVWLALYAVLFATVLTYLLNTWALRHTHSSQVALYINVQPLVAVALHAALGEPLPGHRFFIALLLVALALWLQTRGTASRAPAARSRA